MNRSLTMAIAVTVTLLIGCSEGESMQKQADVSAVVPTQADIARAEEISPADAALAGIYERSCKSCHSLVDAKAPLTGHKASWDNHIAEKGIEGLIESARNGFNGMPAMGFCADCNDEDFRALITFMAGRDNGL